MSETETKSFGDLIDEVKDAWSEVVKNHNFTPEEKEMTVIERYRHITRPGARYNTMRQQTIRRKADKKKAGLIRKLTRVIYKDNWSGGIDVSHLPLVKGKGIA